MLTNAAAKAAGAQSRAYKLHDQGGMHLLVRPTGTKSWQLKYRWRGREKLLTIGQFPEINVARARILQAQAKEQLEQGVDPSRAQRSADSFEQLARGWHRHHRASWSQTHAADVLASLERDVFPELGARPIGAVQPRELLDIVRLVERRGCLETAGRLRQRLSAIFGFGIAEGLCEDDPAAQLGRAMKKGKLSVPHPALTSIDDCRALLAACEVDRGAAVSIMASRFLALTAVRLAAVRGMRWTEVDLEARIWTVPAERMKLSKPKKGEERFDHVVPLSEEALWILRGVRPASIGGEPQVDRLVFPGRSSGPIGEGTLRELYNRAGFAGRHVPHGWRSSFSTILNEDLGPEWRTDIDRALAHSPKDKVEAAYNRAQLLDRRRVIFDRWGELLSA
ncbi:tyrosine-type recombinase/integrase [Qipengyuania sp.]|uniref:tyrosine-type recombinase/integrase n=1 Tax=Qipengyuania sp. TaxID=2004515 RepID=UPI0035126AB9